MDKRKRVLIVGGGAAGLIAAIVAGRNGAEVTILEQMQRVGKKILATGNGRCNLTNVNIKLDRYHGNKVDFAVSALEEFDFSKTLKLFEELGISYKIEEDGKIYPYSDQASSVLDTLRYELKRLNIEESCETEVKKILQSKNELTLILGDGSKLTGDSVILATGGRANANLGSTGTGYRLATDLGHRLIDTFPALVQLKLNYNSLKALAGVKFIGSAEIISQEKIIRKEGGEILFTDYGISGPPILQLSRCVGELQRVGAKSKIRLDMFPGWSMEETEATLTKKIRKDSEKPLDFTFVGLLNKKLIPIVIKAAGIMDIHIPCVEVLEEDIKNIAKVLKAWEFEITGTQPWRDAQVTAGGISTMEVDDKTMASKIVKGLYFCGEILDIDGDCGGFNLQWAWSSGYMAGLSASKK